MTDILQNWIEWEPCSLDKDKMNIAKFLRIP